MPKTSPNPIPPGMPSLTPHIVCKDALKAIDFYVQAFDAKVEGKMMTPDGQKLMHAMVRIGNSPLMLADEFPDWQSLGPQPGQGKPVIIHLYVTDVDATVERAVAAGAKVVLPVSDMFWGDRYGQIDDPFGHRWSVATHKYDMTPEEMKEAMAKQGCGS